MLGVVWGYILSGVMGFLTIDILQKYRWLSVSDMESKETERARSIALTVVSVLITMSVFQNRLNLKSSWGLLFLALISSGVCIVLVVSLKIVKLVLTIIIKCLLKGINAIFDTDLDIKYIRIHKSNSVRTEALTRNIPGYNAKTVYIFSLEDARYIEAGTIRTYPDNIRDRALELYGEAYLPMKDPKKWRAQPDPPLNITDVRQIYNECESIYKSIVIDQDLNVEIFIIPENT